MAVCLRPSLSFCNAIALSHDTQGGLLRCLSAVGTDCGPSLHTFRTRLGQCNNNNLWPNTFMAPAFDLPNTLQSGVIIAPSSLASPRPTSPLFSLDSAH